MQKYITKELTQPLKVVILGLVLGLGINYAFAGPWTAPTANPPENNTPAPINVSDTPQQKGANGVTNALFADGMFGSLRGTKPWSIMADKIFNYSDLVSWGDFTVGSATVTSGFGGSRTSTFWGDAIINKGMLTIDRTAGGSRDMATFLAPTAENRVSLITNKPAFQFWSTVNGDNEADLWGRYYLGDQVQLGAGGAGAGKVLTSTNTAGAASWGTVAFPTIDIKYVSTIDNDGGNPRLNKAYCPTGYVAIGGGGDCEDGGVRISRPISGSPNGGDWTWSTLPETTTDTGAGSANNGPANGWLIGCGDKPNGNNFDIHVDVICMKQTAGSITYPPSPITGGGTGTPTGTGWVSVSYPDGTNGQTCNAWLTANDPGSSRFDYRTVSDIGIPSPYIEGNCVYEGPSLNGLNIECRSAWLSPGAAWKPVSSCTDTVSWLGMTLEKRQ